MRLSNVAGMYLDRLRGRIGQEVLAFVGIAAGVALLFAALVANTSLTGSFEHLTASVVGDARFQLSARGSGTLNEDALAEAQRLPGVAEAAATLEARAEAHGQAGRRSVQLIGVTPEFGALGGAFTKGGVSYRFLAGVRAMALPTPVAKSVGAALGESVALDIGNERVMARLGAKLQESDIGALVNSPVALAPLRYVQELTRKPGRISRVFVVPEPGQDAVVEAGLKRVAGGHADVRPADFDAALFRQASVPTSQSTTSSLYSVRWWASCSRSARCCSPFPSGVA